MMKHPDPEWIKAQYIKKGYISGPEWKDELWCCLTHRDILEQANGWFKQIKATAINFSNRMKSTAEVSRYGARILLALCNRSKFWRDPVGPLSQFDCCHHVFTDEFLYCIVSRVSYIRLSGPLKEVEMARLPPRLPPSLPPLPMQLLRHFQAGPTLTGIESFKVNKFDGSYRLINDTEDSAPRLKLNVAHVEVLRLKLEDMQKQYVQSDACIIRHILEKRKKLAWYDGYHLFTHHTNMIPPLI